MNPELSKRVPNTEGSQAAMIRAARRAAEEARRHGQPLVLWKDGKVVRVMPDELPELPDIAPDVSGKRATGVRETKE